MEQTPTTEWEGKRIRLIEMVGDVDPVASGTTGTIVKVHPHDLIEVDWDSDRALGIIPSVDKFEFID
jgi:hypothetical protein